MSNYEKIYWLTRLDGIHGFILFLAIASTAAYLIIIIGSLVSADFDQFHRGDELKARLSTRKKFTSKVKLLIFVSTITIISYILFPSKNDAILIIAGGKTIDFVESDTSIKKIPEQTTLIISQLLDKQIKELKQK